MNIMKPVASSMRPQLAPPVVNSFFRTAQDPRGEAQDALRLAAALGNLGRYEEAFAAALEAQELCLGAAEVRGEAEALKVLSDLKRADGQLDAALEAAEERDLEVCRFSHAVKRQKHILQSKFCSSGYIVLDNKFASRLIAVGGHRVQHPVTYRRQGLTIVRNLGDIQLEAPIGAKSFSWK